MILLRRILLAILLLLVVFVSIAFLLPRKFTIKQSINISAQRAIVFEQLAISGNWQNWFSCVQHNISSVKPSSNASVGITADSNAFNCGNLNFYISRISPYDSMQITVNCIKGVDLQAYIYLIDSLSGSQINFNLQFELGTNPINRWIGWYIRKSAEKTLRVALDNLKTYVSGLPVAGINVSVSSIGPMSALVIQDSTSGSDLEKKLENMYKQLSMSLIRQKIKPSGPPFLIYYSIQPEKIVIEAGIPLEGKAKSDKFIALKEFKSEHAIKSTIRGKQDKTLVYKALKYFSDSHHYTISGPAFEFYITNPVLESDSEKWQTDIYYPVSINDFTK